MILKRTLSLSLALLLFASSTYGQGTRDTDARDGRQPKEENAEKLRQLLDISRKLKLQNVESERIISETQLALKTAKEKCIEVCDNTQMKRVLELIKDLSSSNLQFFYLLNAVRGYYGAPDGRILSDRAFDTVFTPHKTRLGKLILTASAVYGVAAITDAYLQYRENYTKEEMTELEHQLTVAKINLESTTRNLEINNRAIEQTMLLQNAKAGSK